MKSEKEIAEKTRTRKQRANEKQYANYDRVSVVLPAGTKEKIAETGESINGLINKLVCEYLESKNL